MGIETKSHTSTDAWPLDDVYPHQVTGLREFTFAGGRAFILLQIKIGKGKKKIEYAVGFTPLTFDRMNDEYRLNKDRKSVPLKDLDLYADVRLTKTNDLWSVVDLFKQESELFAAIGTISA
jgi:hypothetical protein